MRYCKECVMPDTRPRIEFDEEGICNACRYAKKKRKIDWDARKEIFKEILDKYRFKDPMKYDCVIPVSGGKDSTYIAYMMKNEYKMNPLAVTFASNMYTDVGFKNAENFKKIGIDHILFTPNREVLKKLSRKMFVEYGDPFIPWVTGVYSIPIRVAVNFKIPLVIYAESGEAEYGGSTEKDDDFEIRETDLRKFVRTGDAKDWKYPENWANEEISLSDLKPYIFPSQEELDSAGVKPIYFGYFHYWDDYENYKFVKEKIGFNEVEGRKEGTYTAYSSIDDKLDDVYMHLMYLKYGFARATKDACKDIRAGRLTRDEAIELVRKYDGELPYQYLRDVLNFLDMDEREFWRVMESFRNKEILEEVGDEWRLKNPIWEEGKGNKNR